MKIVKVFPDYCSSGLWHDGANCDESEFHNVLYEVDFIALKYWHAVWEWVIAEGGVSEKYIQQWNIDGSSMVNEWNNKQNKVLFMYIKTEV